jgi:hypothetical protein
MLAGGGVGQAREHHADGGLARAGFAHHAQGAPLVQGKVGALDRMNTLRLNKPVLSG